MNPFSPGTFWWAREEFIRGNAVKDESGHKYHASDTSDEETRQLRWDTIFRFTVREFESGAWVLYSKA